ncbi:hypothetical protein V8J82_23500 [Gymnodinialimonas sp. 2305UL16-5]|uniref:hypothetical protein n=1 Tax=Gymnodinialimonas mytili TaxID=3126503 RepID=UPI0030B51AD9
MTRKRPVIGLILLALLFGLVYRIYPIATGMPDLAEAFITEDGYLMLTVARNMAIGLGMTVSEGTIPTNGVQPMATFLFTLPYLATGGDRVAGLVGIHLILAAISVGGLFAVRAFAARMLRDQDAGALLPWLVAALWFLGPVLLRHSMNALETGLITLVTVAVLLQFGRVIGQGAQARPLDRLGLGLLCGLVFLARIDAAILVVAIFAVWALDILIRQRQGFGTVLAWLFPAGLLSLAVAAPWLLNNYLGFGSIMPSSGPAQSLNAEFASHAELIPAKIFEYLFPMVPVPRPFERQMVMMVIFGAVSVLILLIFLVQVLRKGDPVVRAVVAAYTLHALALVAYYGLFFGAPHFLSRYLAPLAPLLIVAAVWVALDLGRLTMRARPRLLALLYGWGGVALSAALLIRLLLPGAPPQGHEQVIAWVQDNVPPEIWIGAVQTGTLGYWHDRTINLDGKVNPEALAARQNEGHVLAYITDSEIDYVVDWAGLGTWLTRPEGQPYFAEAFEIVVDDRAANLAVLRRRGSQHGD